MPVSRSKRKKPAPKRGSGFYLTEQTVRDLQLLSHISLSAMADGTACEADLHNLIARLNLGYLMTTKYWVGNEWVEALEQALDVIRPMGRQTLGEPLPTEAVVAIGYALLLSDLVLAECSRRETANSLAEVIELAATDKRF